MRIRFSKTVGIIRPEYLEMAYTYETEDIEDTRCGRRGI